MRDEVKAYIGEPQANQCAREMTPQEKVEELAKKASREAASSGRHFKKVG
jgi:hypothetical protein